MYSFARIGALPLSWSAAQTHSNFEMKTPPVSFFLKKAAKLDSGAKTPGREAVGEVSKAQVREIAQQKMKDLNCATIEAAMKMIEGSARSMGIAVKE